MAQSGTVNLSRSLADWVDEHECAKLPRIPVPTRDHQPRRLALPSLLSELPGCRRSPRRTGGHRLLREHPAVVSEVRSRVGPGAQAATSALGRHLAPGRTLRDHPRAAAVPLACRGPGRRHDRHPRPASSRSMCGRALLPEAPEGAGRRTSPAGDRQAEELRCSPPKGDAFCSPRHRCLREQPCGSLPPADPPARATNAAVQIAGSSATILVRARNHPESLPSRTKIYTTFVPRHHCSLFKRTFLVGQ